MAELEAMDLRSIQKPLKEKYRSEPDSSRITLRARSTESDTPIACSVEVGQKLLDAQAHRGVGGPGKGDAAGRKPDQGNKEVVQTANHDPYSDWHQEGRDPVIQPLDW